MREYTRDSTRENCHLRRRRLGGVQGDDIGAEATLFRMMMKSISRVIEKKKTLMTIVGSQSVVYTKESVA